MAAVYEAVHVDIGKRVAVKLLMGHLATSQTVVERFLREARAVSQIRSPHICDVHDSGRFEDGAPYLVFELLEGESLYEAMCRDRQMSPSVTLAIILQVSRGLQKAHATHIVHRDLKPENIFLTVDEDGRLRVKVLDFGLAKFYDPVGVDGPDKNARLTREGAVFGTPAYMSPEQVRGQAAADTRADLWALACITYECFTGTTVWSTDEGVAMTFAQIATAPLPEPRKYRPDLPETFSAWFKKALDRDIAVRFQTIEEFADGLVTTFDYAALGGGLDAGLVSQITNEAAQAPDAQAITKRTRRKAAQAAKASADSMELMRASGSSSGGPVSSAAPFSSASPSPVELQQAEQLLVRVESIHRRNRSLKLFGGVALVLGLIATVIILSQGKGQPTYEDARRYGAVAAELAKAEPPKASGFQFVAKHPWLPLVREAQALIGQGEHDRALATLRRVYEQHRHGMVHNLMEQVQVALQARTSEASCQVTGFARPRRYDLLSHDIKAKDATAPAIVRGMGGAVVAWTDGRDGQRRAYAAPLDDAMRNRGIPVDITPEGTKVFTPTLLPVAKRYLAAYWDMSGNTAGVYLRWLGPDAVIAAPPIPASEKKAGAYFASAARHGEGYVVAWADRIEADSVDLFFRLFDKDGKATGEAVRVTDYVNQGSATARVREVKVATAGNKLYFAYGFIRGALQQVRFLSVPASTKAPGLALLKKGETRKKRIIGDEVTLTPRTQRGTRPSLACSKEGCFVAWNMALKGGSSVALMDAATGQRRWHKRFTNKGKYPAVSVSPGGDARLVWVESGRITTATIGREGVGPTSKVARVAGRHPPPVIAPGSKSGEWYVSWLDYESGHREPYALRMQCQ